MRYLRRISETGKVTTASPDQNKALRRKVMGDINKRRGHNTRIKLLFTRKIRISLSQGSTDDKEVRTMDEHVEFKQQQNSAEVLV